MSHLSLQVLLSEQLLICLVTLAIVVELHFHFPS